MPVPSSYNDITTDKSLRDYVGWAWYDREFFASPDWKNKRIVLRIDSAHYYSMVVSSQCHKSCLLPWLSVSIRKCLPFVHHGLPDRCTFHGLHHPDITGLLVYWSLTSLHKRKPPTQQLTKTE